MEVICIIPARGNSKRLPGKNVKPLNGKPLIAYSIEAWMKSKYCKSKAIVSTDDPEIAAVSSKCGARVIMRPSSLAQDNTPTLPVIRHVVDYLEKYDCIRVHYVLILQPTSPLRTTEDIDKCLDVIARNEADSVTSFGPDGKENGAVYVTHANLIKQGTLYGPRLYPYVMPPERSVDIDTQEDFEKVEEIIQQGGILMSKNDKSVSSNVKGKCKKGSRNAHK